jgi:hypothetical protein
MAALFGVLMTSTVLVAQTASNSSDSEKELVQTLMHRVEQLEAEIARMKEGQQPSGNAASSPAAGLVAIRSGWT